MDWKRLLVERRVEAAAATRQELDELRVMVERNLRDAGLDGISDEGCFSMAYNAARLLAVIAIRASGYRVKQPGAHYNTFLALQAVAKPSIAGMSAYLHACREKRNEVSYVKAYDVSHVEAEELLREAKKLRDVVHQWLMATHPHLV